MPEPHIWPSSEIEIAASVPDALHELSMAVMADPARRPWLTQDFAVTLDAAGEGDLLTAVGSITGETGEIILDGIWYGVVLDADSNILVPLMHYADFLKPQPTVFSYYTLKDQIIATRAINTAVNGPLDIVGVSGPLTITASFTPINVTDLPLSLEDDAVRHLVLVLQRKGPAA
jgi:hypothetical protein